MHLIKMNKTNIKGYRKSTSFSKMEETLAGPDLIFSPDWPSNWSIYNKGISFHLNLTTSKLYNPNRLKNLKKNSK
jgi:hypothetical protein